MRIVFVANVFSEKTGYITNCLPKALVKLGHEVHVIAPNVQVYFNSPDYDCTYRSFLGPPIVPVEVKKIDGFTLHRLPHKAYKTEVYIKGLYKKLKILNPDIVQCFSVDSVLIYHLAFYKVLLSYKLFTANHILKSVFPMHNEWNNLSLIKRIYWNLRHFLPGRMVSRLSTKAYAQTIDAKEIAVNYFGVLDKKCSIDPLGVDTDFFKPMSKEVRNSIKESYGFEKEDFICIYTGRFSEAKNPLILAKAINELQKVHKNIKGLFIGSGMQENEIKKMKGVQVSDFVSFDKLANVYNCANIGVWPREDSTSMLDALACGLPIVVSENVKAKERVDGCGLVYKEGDFIDLSKKIEWLFKNEKEYELMSAVGHENIYSNFSWDKIAQKRIKDYIV